MILTRRHWVAAFLTALLIHVAAVLAAVGWFGDISTGAGGAHGAGLAITLGPMAGVGRPTLLSDLPPLADAVETVAPADPVAAIRPELLSEPLADVKPIEAARASPNLVVEAKSITATDRSSSESIAAPAERAARIKAATAARPVLNQQLAVETAPVSTVPPKPMIVATSIVGISTRRASLNQPTQHQTIDPQPADSEPAEIPPSIAPKTAIPETIKDVPLAAVAAAPSDAISGDGRSGSTLAGGADQPGIREDYFRTLQLWLEKHKRYPKRARARGIEGTAVLYFAINQAGVVLEQRIERSAGHVLLDNAVTAMIARATPLPAIPATLHTDRLALTVPIQFTLDR